MKILLPNNQEIELPENFSSVAFFSDDMLYEIAFFRKDVLHLVQNFCYTTTGMKEYRNFNEKQDCCHDITHSLDLEEGLYQICFTFDYDDDAYYKAEYEIDYSSND